MDKNLKIIQDTFATVFGVSPSDITLETSIENFNDWDSMRHLEIITSIEAAFGIQFNMGEIIHLNSVEKILQTIPKT